MVLGFRLWEPTPNPSRREGRIVGGYIFIATCCDIFYGVSHILYCVCFEPSERR